MKNNYKVKHNFMHEGQFKEAGNILKADPTEVRYLVLGGQIEEMQTENTKQDDQKKKASK